MAQVDSLSGRTLALAGRVHGVSFARLQRLVEARGGLLLRRPSRKVTVLVVCASASHRLLDEADRIAADGPADLISERDLLVLVGLARPFDGDLTIEAQHLARLARIDPDLLPVLRLFDVVEGGPERFGYRDLVAVRQVADLLKQGVLLADVVEAAAELRRRGLSLSEARLAEAPWGGLRRIVDGTLATLDGQLEFDAIDDAPSVDELLDAAERAAESGDEGAAMLLYRTALRAEPANADACYSLALLLQGQENHREAKLWLQAAVSRDPGFADAWFALGYGAERAGAKLEAGEAYRRAIRAAPEFPDPLFNLALMLTKEELYAEALPLWQRYLDMVPGLPPSHPARRGLTLCRLSGTWAARGQTASRV